MTRAQKPYEYGFSLIEMLAALAVLSIAGVALMNALTTSTRAASLAEARGLASIAADNVMAELMAERRVTPLRDRSGQYQLAGRQFNWRLDVENTDQFELDQVVLVLTDPDSDIEQARLISVVRSRS